MRVRAPTSAAATLAAVSWCSCLSVYEVAHEPIRPSLQIACGEPTYAGHPVDSLISWSCTGRPAGRSSAANDACAREVIDIRATCSGVPCRVEVDGELGGSHGIGQRRASAISDESGRLALSYLVTRRDGTSDLLAGTCDVEPAPALTIECATREVESGALVPCGTFIPAGVEVHATGVLEVASGDLPLSFDLSILHGPPGAIRDREDTDCHDESHAGRRARSCMWISKWGAYRIVLSSGNASVRRALAAGMLVDPETGKPLAPD